MVPLELLDITTSVPLNLKFSLSALNICAGREKTESTGDLESQRLVL